MINTLYYRFTLFALTFVSCIAITGVPPAAAQGLQARDLKVKIGATRTEMKSGANVNLWAVLIGISRFKNGDQNAGGTQNQNLKSASDDAQAIYDYLRSDE